MRPCPACGSFIGNSEYTNAARLVDSDAQEELKRLREALDTATTRIRQLEESQVVVKDVRSGKKA